MIEKVYKLAGLGNSQLGLIDTITLFLIGSSGAATIAYSVLDRVNLPGLSENEIITDANKSISDIKNRLEDKNTGYYKQWEVAFKELKKIEGPYSPSFLDEDVDKVTNKLDDIKNAIELRDVKEGEKLSKDLSDLKDMFVHHLSEFEKRIQKPTETLRPIFDMKLEELGKIQWEIEKLQSALQRNWLDIEDYTKEIRRWAIPLYILVGGAIAAIFVYVQGGGQLSLSLQSVLIAFGVGAAWTPVAKYLKSISQEKVKLGQNQ